jgi:hypothetical protein
MQPDLSITLEHLFDKAAAKQQAQHIKMRDGLNIRVNVPTAFQPREMLLTRTSRIAPVLEECVMVAREAGWEHYTVEEGTGTLSGTPWFKIIESTTPTEKSLEIPQALFYSE